MARGETKRERAMRRLGAVGSKRVSIQGTLRYGFTRSTLPPAPSLKREGGKCGRDGFTLFEVVLALAIFLGAFAVLNQILESGSRAAIRSQVMSQAVDLAERKMSEILSGITPLASAPASSFDFGSSQTQSVEAQNWTWSANVSESGVVGLMRVEVTVDSAGPGFRQETFSLVRFARDPAYLANLELEAAAVAADAAAAAAGAAAP